MDIPTVPGALYTVATKITCDITDAATGTPIDSASAGSVTFTAQGAVTTLSDPEATYARVNFKNAAAALRLLGGGEKLPFGYLAAEFLRSTGVQYINLQIRATSTTGIICRHFTKTSSDVLLAGAREGNSRFLCPIMRGPNYSVGYGWGSWEAWQYGVTPAVATGMLNLKNSRKAQLFSAEKQWGGSLVEEIPEQNIEMFLFSYNNNGSPNLNFNGNVYYAKITKQNETVCILVPAIDAAGVPCMYDTIRRAPFYNVGTGSFIVGLTLSQARKLDQLPTGGGTLKISIPENYTADEAVGAALSTATENGWIFEIQTYTTAEAAASTFALRRIWVKKTAAPDGAYVDANGARWHVEWCQTVLGADPTDLGYEPFRSVDVALAEWELTPYIYPEEETLSI